MYETQIRSLWLIAVGILVMLIAFLGMSTREPNMIGPVQTKMQHWQKWSKVHCRVISKEYGMDKDVRTTQSKTYACDNGINYTVSDDALLAIEKCIAKKDCNARSLKYIPNPIVESELP